MNEPASGRCGGGQVPARGSSEHTTLPEDSPCCPPSGCTVRPAPVSTAERAGLTGPGCGAEKGAGAHGEEGLSRALGLRKQLLCGAEWLLWCCLPRGSSAALRGGGGPSRAWLGRVQGGVCCGGGGGPVGLGGEQAERWGHSEPTRGRPLPSVPSLAADSQAGRPPRTEPRAGPQGSHRGCLVTCPELPAPAPDTRPPAGAQREASPTLSQGLPPSSRRQQHFWVRRGRAVSSRPTPVQTLPVTHPSSR